MSDSKRSGLIFLFVLLIAAGLIVSYPEQTVAVNTSRGWFTRPQVAPLFGLSILLLFSFLQFVLTLKDSMRLKLFSIDTLINTIGEYKGVLLMACLFLLYIASIEYLGFFLSTLLFVHTLLWLSRLLNRFWSVAAWLTVIAVVLIFRVGVNIWFPDVALYELLFDGKVLWFMNSYL
ncbi:hypothetical protein [Gynuella sunshinyii]|uniref:Tripartite tricarboxylate transporter TctB family n=1 Tax=Gynuella sunshinyii YC6258 TaxID=1445510 RepID=A0A0C5VU02_9GAMM|nr:hypothetical protein [Gynuella sunshinyii]AJQ97661.1 hypothetical Protein YC6258_05633 [Gynuella sunshinyii YC6258]